MTNGPKNNVCNILTCHTPFHLIQIKNLIEARQINISLKTFVFHSDSIEKREFENLFNAATEINTIPKYTSTYIKIWKSLLKEYLIFHKAVNSFKQLLKMTFSKIAYNHYLIYSGTDKHIFDQCLFFTISQIKTNQTIHIFDEGVGCYLDKNPKSGLYNWIFSSISHLIFGVPFIRIDKLGSHPSTNTIFARFPDIINREPAKSYYPILGTNKLEINYGPYIIILTSPFFEEGAMTTLEYESLLKTIIHVIRQNDVLSNWKIFIKPHPREGLEVLKSLPVEQILPSEAIENMQKIQIGLVIGFDTSAFIELIGSGVSKDRIVNISPFKNSIIKDILKVNTIQYKNNDVRFLTNLKYYVREFADNQNNL